MYRSYRKNQRIMYGQCTDHVRIMCVHTVWVFPPVGNHHVLLSDDGFACVGQLLPIHLRTTVSVHRGVLSEPCGSAQSPRNIAATPRPFRSLRNTPFMLRPGLAVRLSMIRTWSVHGPYMVRTWSVGFCGMIRTFLISQ